MNVFVIKFCITLANNFDESDTDQSPEISKFACIGILYTFLQCAYYYTLQHTYTHKQYTLHLICMSKEYITACVTLTYVLL